MSQYSFYLGPSLESLILLSCMIGRCLRSTINMTSTMMPFHQGGRGRILFADCNVPPSSVDIGVRDIIRCSQGYVIECRCF